MSGMPKKLVGAFSGNKSGAIALLFAFAITAIAGFGALSIDFGRAYMINSKMSGIADAAAMAGARALSLQGKNDSEVQTIAANFFNVNVKAAGLEHLVAGTVNVTVNRGKEEVTVEAETKLDVGLAKLLGVGPLKADHAATAALPTNDVEVVFALDFTGSMTLTPVGDTQSKFEALRETTRTSVNTLYAAASRDEAMRIAIVPWSIAVGPAPGMAQLSDDPADVCVSERGTYADTTDTAPVAGDFFGTTEADKCPTKILPLSDRSKQSDVITYVNNMTVTNWATAGHQSAAWGWYMLSPKWASALPADAKPREYSDMTKKVVVIMSDGEFNNTGFNHDGSDVDKSYEVFQKFCTNMKALATPIYIFTIGFDLGTEETRAKTELKTCATNADYFFDAKNNSELQKAFSKIVDKVNKLRIKR